MRRRLHSVLPVAACAVAVGCGGGEDGSSSAAELPADHRTVSAAVAFPHGGGRPLSAVLAALPEGPALQPSVTVLTPGRNRVAFALYDTAGKQLSGASVALYVSNPDGTAARGPYVARSESLAVKHAFRSAGAAGDEDDARSVYVADVPFESPGPIALVAIARLDGRLVASHAFSMLVRSGDAQPPAVGERAPRISTRVRMPVTGVTARDIGMAKTASLNQVDAATVLGRKPIVLVFATSRTCTSRVCAPVLDVAAQVHAEAGDALAVVHQEAHTDGAADMVWPWQVRAYRLPTEPWTFVVNRRGRISARFEGPLSVGELRRAVSRVVRVRD